MTAFVSLAASGAGAIPFRQDSGAAATTATGALLITVLLLAVVALVAWYARRRGWLDRWLGSAVPISPVASLRVEQVLRLSPRTTLYRVRDNDRTLLLIESHVNARIVTGDGVGGHGEDDAAGSR